jgi:hypothetical protein
MDKPEGIAEQRRTIVTGRMNPSIEHLVAELIDCEQQLANYKSLAEKEQNKEKLKIIELCNGKIAQIRQAIQPDKRCTRKRIFIAWELLHRVGEEMVTLMDTDTLSAEIGKLITDIKISSLPDAVRNDLLLQLDRERNKLDGDAKNAARAAAVLKAALNVLNSVTDDRFWDIWSKKLGALIYTLMIPIFGIPLIYQLCCPKNWCRSMFAPLTISTILLLGAVGGLTSGIVTGERESLPKGHFWVSIIYYALVRPIIGAVAAVLMFWMIQNHFLVSIDIYEPSVAATAPARLEQANTLQPAPVPDVKSAKSAVSTTKKEDTDKKEVKTDTDFVGTLIKVKAEKGKENYMYAFFIFLAGFLGDKLLKSVADKVSSKLFAEAEKTREAK